MSSFNPEFLKGETWGQPGETVEHIETHVAHIFLCGQRAFKIKKPVKLPYLDFSTLEKREAVINLELALNQAFAPAIYLSVIKKFGEPVLEMRRFSQDALLSNMLKKRGLEDSECEAIAKTIAYSHHTATSASVRGIDIISGLGQQLEAAFEANPGIFPEKDVISFRQQHRRTRQALETLLNKRTAAGFARRCHGDLHCGNIVIEDHAPFLFDAIEFSEKIATVDVLYDLAFLVMDLCRFNCRAAANSILNHYLNLRRPQEDLSGLAAMPIFLSTRAGVRALVAADRARDLEPSNKLLAQQEALSYFNVSSSYLFPAKPLLFCTGGLSGTGKTTISRTIAHYFDPPPGAIHIRSDIERKILAGWPEKERLPESHYGAEISLAVYRVMLERAERALCGGRSVILDAVFALESERKAAEELAGRLGLDFLGVWLEAPAEEMKQRVAQRKSDASDATAAVVEKQLQRQLGAITWNRIDAVGIPSEVAKLVLRAIGF